MNKNLQVALFGEAERGLFGQAYRLETLPQMVEYLGNPPPESSGLIYGVQVLLYERELIYFRVKEEGFSYQDYFQGFRLLKKNLGELNLAAICLPGVGSSEIIEEVTDLCDLHKSVMITSEPDLYDYLTD